MWKIIENNNLLRLVTVFVTTILILLFSTIVVLPILVIILLYRWLVGRAAKWFQGQKLGKLLPATSALLGSGAFYTKTAVNIVVVGELDCPTLDVDALRASVEKKLLSATIPNSNEILYPEFKSILRSWMGFLFWAPCVGFDIKDHVKSVKDIADAPPYDPENPMAQTRLIAYLTRDRIWNKDKPLWEIIYVENAILGEMNNTSLICVRIHHSMADGWSLFKATVKLFGKPEMLEKAPQFRVPTISGLKEWILRSWLWTKLPFEAVDHFLTVLSDRTQIAVTETLSMSPNDGTKGQDGFGVMEDVLSLDRFKKLKNKFEVDFHSMVVAGIAAAVRNSYQDAGKQVPENVRFSFPHPMPGHPDKLRNHLSVGTIILPIGEKDSVKRLKIISSRIHSGMRAGLPLFNFYMMRLLGCMPLEFHRRSRGSVSVPPILLTNLVGPSEPLFWEGKQFLDVKFSINMPFEGTEGLAYGVGLVTYCGRTKLGVGGLKHYFPSMEHARKFLNYCVDEWKYLETVESDGANNVTSFENV